MSDFYKNFLTDSNYYLKVIEFEKLCFINPEVLELTNLSTLSRCPTFPKYGYNREMDFKIQTNDLYKCINTESPIKFGKTNKLKSIYICNNELTSIFKLSHIITTSMKFASPKINTMIISTPELDEIVIRFNEKQKSSLEISCTIDVSSCEMITDEDENFLIKTMLMSRR